MLIIKYKNNEILNISKEKFNLKISYGNKY